MRKIITLTVLAIIIVSGCSNTDKDYSLNNEPLYEEQNNEGFPNNEPQINETSKDSKITLPFQSVNNEQKISKVSQIEEESIIKEQEVMFGNIIIYSKQTDNEHVYGAYKTKEDVYDLGKIGGQHNEMNDDLISIKELTLFDKTLVRIDGVYGANAPVQNYFSIDGEITPFLRIDTGHATEADLDENGTSEIVSSHGTPMQTYIYRWDDGKFIVSDVNKALGAISVYINEEMQIEAFFDQDQKNKLFEYDSGILKLLN